MLAVDVRLLLRVSVASLVRFMVEGKDDYPVLATFLCPRHWSNGLLVLPIPSLQLHNYWQCMQTQSSTKSFWASSKLFAHAMAMPQSVLPMTQAAWHSSM